MSGTNDPPVVKVIHRGTRYTMRPSKGGRSAGVWRDLEWLGAWHLGVAGLGAQIEGPGKLSGEAREAISKVYRRHDEPGRIRFAGLLMGPAQLRAEAVRLREVADQCERLAAELEAADENGGAR